MEIGCGPGRITALITRKIRNGEVVATDISQNMIEKAGESMTLSGLTNIKFACINALAMQFGNEFDAIFSNCAIHLGDQARRLYKKLFKVLLLEGRILIDVPGQSTESSLLSSVPDIFPFGLSSRITRKQLEWAGFSNISVETRLFEQEIDEAISVGESAFGINKLGTHEEMKQKLVDYLNAMGAEQTGEIGVITIPMLFINAQKGA